MEQKLCETMFPGEDLHSETKKSADFGALFLLRIRYIHDAIKGFKMR